ncbi:MAG: GNAT family N-acetyltransferase [Saprospiraceae bacterium]
MEVIVEDNGRKGRFALYIDASLVCEMTFVWSGSNKIIIDHTGIENGFNGKGYGNVLMAKAVEFARVKKIKILPLCPFAKSRFDKDPSISDVLF